MKQFLFFIAMSMASLSAHATVRSGNTSFGGIQVKVAVDETQGYFQIGESRFSSAVTSVNGKRVMQGSSRVGIMTWDETLTATIFLDGGDGGNIQGFQEYPCTDIRITIVRVKDDGTRTILKNECGFLN